MNVKNHMIPDEASKSTSHCQYIITERWMGYTTKGVTICCSFCKAYKFTVNPCNIIVCKVIKIYRFCAINISFIALNQIFFSLINQLSFKKIILSWWSILVTSSSSNYLLMLKRRVHFQSKYNSVLLPLIPSFIPLWEI